MRFYFHFYSLSLSELCSPSPRCIFLLFWYFFCFSFLLAFHMKIVLFSWQIDTFTLHTLHTHTTHMRPHISFWSIQMCIRFYFGFVGCQFPRGIHHIIVKCFFSFERIRGKMKLTFSLLLYSVQCVMLGCDGPCCASRLNSEDPNGTIKYRIVVFPVLYLCRFIVYEFYDRFLFRATLYHWVLGYRTQTLANN